MQDLIPPHRLIIKITFVAIGHVVKIDDVTKAQEAKLKFIVSIENKTTTTTTKTTATTVGPRRAPPASGPWSLMSS